MITVSLSLPLGASKLMSLETAQPNWMFSDVIFKILLSPQTTCTMMLYN